METDAGPSGLTSVDGAHTAAASPSTRLTRRALTVIVTALAVVTAGIAAVGYLALRAHWSSQTAAGARAAAVTAAKECVAATQPSDAAALPAIQNKLDDCSTGDFKTQIIWYRAVLREAYRAVNLHVRLPEIDAAVERTNSDGSIVALIAFRANISRDGMADRENSYRMRVTMLPDSGHFKVAKLDQAGK
jgi:Mce-associated membrane protein